MSYYKLVVNFEYKPTASGDNNVDTSTEQLLKNKYGKSLNKNDMPNLAMAEIIIAAVTNLDNLTDYANAIQQHAPTEKIKKRPLIVKYINQYTAKNTMDYFIHKDLGGFLTRELDFYLKNEVMNLDNIADANAEDVTNYLAKLKVIRKIGTKLIAFLAQLENFQKKLWLKKKFVTATNYCISLDRIDAEFYPEIAKNTQQHDEWLKLFAINELPNYSKPLTVDFLKQNTNLVLDTVFFSEDFTAKLIATIDNFDEQCDGLLVHSENFQALNLLQERYREQVKCVYIDPPYNTDSAPIAYKNNYKDSSWNSLIENRMTNSISLLEKTGLYVIAIDDIEYRYLVNITDIILNKNNYITTITTLCNPQGRVSNKVSKTSEFHLLYAKNIDHLEDLDTVKIDGPKNDTTPLKRTGTNSRRIDRPLRFFPILYKNKKFEMISEDEYFQIYNRKNKKFNDEYLNKLIAFYKSQGYEVILPQMANNQEYLVWQREYTRVIEEIYSYIYKSGSIHTPAYMKEIPKTCWVSNKFANPEYGSELVKQIIGEKKSENTAKSVYTLQQLLQLNRPKIILDYFAGSGTTGHATINLNREDGGKRKYILVEMDDYFNTVLKPRIQKVVYANDWKDGKPKTRDTGISHCFKYIRLESYEDSLNNLEFKDDVSQQLKNNKPLHTDYMLNYMLDIDTSGSQSLLNIDKFKEPTNYKLKIKQPNTDQLRNQKIDLIETFNYLIGLRLINMAAPKSYDAKFKYAVDEELPEDQQQKLILDGKIKSTTNGKWWFRVIVGWLPKDKFKPNDFNPLDDKSYLKVLIIWRKLTGNLEQDNLILDEFFSKRQNKVKDKEYNIIYVNGSHNLDNLKQEQDHWKVRLIEEEFRKQMWNIEGAV